jgi:pimeloyl-ACP methyl ester carboxylesterase
VKGEELDEYFRQIWSRFAAPGFAASQPQSLDELVAQITRRPTPRRGLIGQVRAMTSWHGARRLSRISAPTTVLHGDQDPLIPVVNGRILSELVPDARYVELLGVGHLMPYEAGDSLIDALVCAPTKFSESPT